MKRIPTLALCAALLAAFSACNRSGIIDSTGSATTNNNNSSNSNNSGASSPAASTTGKSAKPARIAHGQRVEIANYVVPGKTTIFDFTSEYCPPCQAIAPMLHKLHASRADVVVVEVDINRSGVRGIDWQSPVAQQYGMQSIPHFKVFGPDGKLRAEGDGARGIVEQMLR